MSTETSPKQESLIRKMVPILVLLNFLDAGATIFALETRIAVELNPFMNLVYNVSPWLFLFFKLFMTFYTGFVIVASRKEQWVFRATVGLVFLYSLLVIYEAVSLFVILRVLP